jgi:PBP1b-binding outer membrane lipoprotein LpoB
MKKSTAFTKVLLLSLLFLSGCSKKDQLSPVNDTPEQNVFTPLSAPLFDELNETIARFDPLYVQIVYKDKKSKAMINEEASRLLVAINQNPTSLVIQKELIDLYHFNSFSELQKASDIISNNSGALKKSFLGQYTVLSKVKMNQLNEARRTFLKNKISTLEKASQRSSSGLWTDNADKILEMWHYFSAVSNQEMGLDMDGGGDGPGCTESCCLEYQTCMTNANSNFTMRLIGYSIGGIFGGISAGGSAGSIIPVIGNIYGAVYGGWLGGIAGYTVAIELYMNDQKVCALNYKACILRKMGN